MLMYKTWLITKTPQLLAKVTHLRRQSARDVEEYNEAIRTGDEEKFDLRERHQELVEGWMVIGQLVKLIVERYMLEFEQKQQAATPSVKLSQKEIDNHLRVGKEHSKEKDYHLAVFQFNHVLLADPDNATAYCYRGLALSSVDLFKQADDDLKRALELQPAMTEAKEERKRIAGHLR
jgi:tetratricopeptide (TPR) repeat protein